MTEPIIKIENLNFRYNTSPILNLKDINLEIFKGEFVGITGESGSGKSTLIYLFNGLIPHFFKGDFEGSVIVLNQNTMDYEIQDFADKVGFLFQNPEFQIFSPDVESEIVFGLENLAIPREQIDNRLNSILKDLEIMDLRYRDTAALSGGQKQLITLASILIMEPKILVLDEPTSFLDPIFSNLIFNILKKIHEKGTTIILISHNTEILAELTQRIIVINKGKIIADKKPSPIFTDIDFLTEYNLQPPPISEFFIDLIEKIGVNFKIPIKFNEGIDILSEILDVNNKA